MNTLFFVLALLFIAALLVYAWYGGFKSIQIDIARQGGETVVYEKITGDYRQSGAVMDRLYYSLLNDYQIKTYKGFGIYHDNPKHVEKAKLRSEAVCIIEPADLDRLPHDLPFSVKQLPEKDFVVCQFPYKGKLSVFFSLMKVYPALNRYAETRQDLAGGSITEICDIPGKTIYYRMEINP